MSKPASRLSAFRSYSYYHVLVMCDSTDTADLLAKSAQLDVWRHATDETRAPDNRPNTPNLGKYSPKCVLDENGRCVGRYIVLIDGSTDAIFSIDQVKITSATAAHAVTGDQGTSLAVEGSLMITEPKGVAFLDQVVKCGIALGVDNSQIVYALKTFFVGYAYSHEHGDVPVNISDIPPVNFITYDVTGNFTERGGTYEMLFVAIANGASRLPQYSKAVTSMNFRSGSDLQSTFKNLNAAIDANYDRYYNCVYKQLESLGTPEALALRDSLCRVKYTIKVEKPYDDKSYVVTDGPAQYNNTGTCEDGVSWTFPPNSSIESAIATIMSRCKKVQDDMSTGDASNKTKFEYKIHSCVKSTPISGLDEEPRKLSYEVIYTVAQFPHPSTIANTSGFTKFAQDESQIRNDPMYNKLRQNVIEFDYIYTGNNTDVLDFDIKVNMGLAYLQTATLANTFKGQLEPAPTHAQVISSQSASTAQTGRFIPGAPVQTPVFFGKQIAHPKMLNKKDANSAVQGAYTLAKHASLEVADATMRIAGNDRLLATTNNSTSAASVEAGAPTFEDTPTDPTEANFKYWNHVPAYAKVNIKMPRENDDFSLFTGQTSDDGTPTATNADYARDFWFDGYYYVVGIEHVFEKGEFTQTLEMISIPKTSAFGSTKNSTDASFEVKLEECYDSKIGCGKSPANPGDNKPQATKIPATPPPTPKDHVEYNTQDANSMLKNNTTLSKVKGWDKPYVGTKNGRSERITVSPEVKKAIQQAANDTEVDATLLAQMCYQESTFDPKATNDSSATGLFQFVNKTWDNFPRDPVLTNAVISNRDNRYDPYINAYAAGRYVKNNIRTLQKGLGPTFTPTPADAYLAHFAGPNGAIWIIEADLKTGGTATIEEAYGKNKKSFKQLIDGNSPYIRKNMTVREIRAWAASKLALALIDPLAITQPQQLLSSNQLVQGSSKQTTKAKDKISVHQDCKTKESKPADEQKSCNVGPEAGSPPVQQKKLSTRIAIAEDRKKHPEKYNKDGTCAPGYVDYGQRGFCQPIKKK